MQNQDQQKINLFKCNCCYEQYGVYIVNCSCMYCKQCLKTLFNQGKNICIICNKNIDFTKLIDLNKKENYAKYSFMFTDPDNIFKKGLESLQFQKNYQKKYVEYLKAKSEINENALKNIQSTSASSIPVNANKVSPRYVTTTPNNFQIRDSNKIKTLNVQTYNMSVKQRNNELSKQLVNNDEQSRDNSKDIKVKRGNINDIYKTPMLNKENFTNYYKN